MVVVLTRIMIMLSPDIMHVIIGLELMRRAYTSISSDFATAQCGVSSMCCVVTQP